MKKDWLLLKKKTIVRVIFFGALFFIVQASGVKAAGITSTSITTGSTGDGMGQVVDSDGYSRFVFVDNAGSSGDLTYVRCTDADCINRVTNVVSSDAWMMMVPGGYVLTLDSNGFAHILYAKSDYSLWVYTCHDDDCSPSGPTATTSNKIADGAYATPGRYGAEITMGQDDFPRIAYYDDYYSSGHKNHFVRCIDAECTSVVNTVVGGENTNGLAGISLTIGADDRYARIVYPQGGDTVEYARCTDDDCTTPVITSVVSNPGNYPGSEGVIVRIGSDGFGRIAYQNQDLHYMTCSNEDCTMPSDVTVTTDASYVRDGIGLAIRSGNLASIAYSSKSDKYLHLVNCTNNTCSMSHNLIVDKNYNNGNEPATNAGVSLVVDSNNLPRMLYSDSGASINTGMRYTRFTAPAPIVAPSITTGFITNVTTTSATLSAMLTSDGGETSAVSFHWGTQSGSYPNTCTSVTSVGSDYACDLSGLTNGVTYYVQASVTNSGGTGNGIVQAFIAGFNSTLITTIPTRGGAGQVIGSDGFSRFAFLNGSSANDLTYVRCTNADCTNKVTNVVDSDANPYMGPGSYILTLGSDGFARIVYSKLGSPLWVYTCHDEDCSPTGPNATTSNQITDGTNYPGEGGAEIAMGQDGSPRMVYYDIVGSANHFVRCIDAECASVVDTVVGGENTRGQAGISLVIGADGYARIVYPQGGDTVEYARCTDDDCTTPVITSVVNDPGNDPGYVGVVVRMGSDGFARIAYLSYDKTLHYLTCSDGDCTMPSDATVTTDASNETSNGIGLTIRTGDLASIAYSGDADQYLHLINCTDATCSTSHNLIIDARYNNGDGYATYNGISLVADSNNFLRMLYSDDYPSETGLRYTHLTSLNPITTPSITTGFITNITANSATLNTTLTSDGGETPTVSFHWGTQSGSYPNTCASVTNVGNVYSCDLSGLTTGVTYYAQASVTNSVGTGNGIFSAFMVGIISTTIVAATDSIVMQNGTGLAIGSDGFSRLVFLEPTDSNYETSNLTYARCTDEGCTDPVMNVVDMVDTNVSWGMRTGSSILTLGTDGFARIVYEKSDGSLWVYTCHDDDCSLATTTSNKIADAETLVPGPGASGMEITMGTDGFPRVAYIDDDGDPDYPHHFVRCLDSDCTSSVNTVLGAPTEWGWGMAGTSLALGTDGFARIVYRQDPDTLEYVRCRNDNCDSSDPEKLPVITPVVNDSGSYSYPGKYGVVVRMGSDGFARIAYADQDNALHYVTCSDLDCTTSSDEPVATDVAQLPNGFGLAIRSGNLASIVYKTESDGYINLINCANPTCSTLDNITVDAAIPNEDSVKGISLVVGRNNLPRLFYSGAYNNGVGERYTYFTSPATTITTPTISTKSATNLNATSATLNATLTDDGGETPTVELKWGTTPGSYPNTCAPTTNVGSAYACNLTGLTADTPYYFQASATNSAGTGTGSEVSFQTTATEVIIPPADPVANPAPIDIADKECKPMDLLVKLQADGKIKLSWKKTCSLIDKIEIERKTEQGEFEKIATVKNDEDTYEDDGSKLPSGKYTYRLRGYRKASGKHSDYSNKKSVTIQHPVIPATTKQEEPAPKPEDTEPTPTPPVVETPQATPNSNNNPPINTHPAPKPSFLGKVLGEATATVKQFAQKSSTELTTLALVGLTAGIAMATSSTAIPLFGTSSAPLSEALPRLFSMFGLVGKKKRKDEWGIVFDSETRRPIPGVAVSIIDEAGHVVETSTSDAQGRYSFLPKPGNYTLAIVKKAYELETTNQQDMLYGDLYTNQAISITGDNMKKISLALKNTTLNWQDFAQRKITAYTSNFSIIKRDFFLVLFYTGFVVNTGIAFLFPTKLNLALFSIYLATAIQHLFFKKKAYGLITNAQNKQPVPFTMLSIYNQANPEKRIAFAVSDVLGRYFILTENGDYLLRAAGNFLGGQRFEKTIPVSIKDGVVRSDVEV